MGLPQRKTWLNKKGIEEGRGCPLPFPPSPLLGLPPIFIFAFYSIKEVGPRLLFLLQSKQRNKNGII